ncbi:hypothetical protein [Dethiosulfatarculus sandiegensis]|uniref:DUF3558 domain-containing protein n=1 Tax=Dethiosulfatarculus sandiegensis TaxID=1429043 RepID=A0A0D2J9B3_9BACT|nr:hypothetical protein [Dethiosulfatarculus sandiegensis]KIX12301.1 hypothetical protein X474_20215 [Dethiosulfatarculus sandiegensis]
MPQKRNISFGIITFVLSCGLMLAGCQGPDTEAENKKPPSGCSLLTTEEAAYLVGKPVEPGAGSMLGCGWAPKGETMSYLNLQVKKSPNSPDHYLGLSPEDGTRFKKVEDLGHEAVIAVREGDVLVLMAWKGPWQIKFTVGFLDIKPDSEGFQRLKATAKKALAKLE